MKAAPFDYVRAESIEQVLELLDASGADARLVAGGQSLVPMMAMRLVRPALLIDINRIATLKDVSRTGEIVTMGATRRQRDVEDDRPLHRLLPLVRDALRWVGHQQTRNRGTVGGSLAHADPSAELPLAAVVLDATLRLRSHGGERSLAASDFFVGPMATAIGEAECLVGIDWPIWSGGRVVTAFDETAMRHGDFAMASAACQLLLDERGVCRRAAFGVGGVDGVPMAFPELARDLIGRRPDNRLIDDIAHAALARTEPGSDLHADADYRRHLGRVMLSRVLNRALAAEPPPMQ